VNAYLLDNNHIQAFFQRESAFMNRFGKIPIERGLFVCDKTLEEIERGHRITVTTNQTRRDEFIAWVQETFSHYRIDTSEHTNDLHDAIRHKILELHPRRDAQITDDAWLERLGVDDYDVWPAAMSWEHNLTFLTQDKMACIREVLNGIVEFDNWR
jgi:predicted nucleic acid-binding protein